MRERVSCPDIKRGKGIVIGMIRRSSWLVALLLVALLVAACGPEMATPTPSTESTNVEPSATVADASPSAAVEEASNTPESQKPPSAELPVDSDDWHVLGSPDAPVTVVEYSDFQ
jgi:protein-disulfide isomerase